MTVGESVVLGWVLLAVLMLLVVWAAGRSGR
jgi:hypothetical protein